MILAARNPFASIRDRDRAGRQGLTIFLVSLGVLFAATLILQVALRFELGRRGVWPRDLAPLPLALIGSTGLLALCSLGAHRAVRAARGGDARRIQRELLLVAASGTLFLVVQGVAWIAWFRAVAPRWEESEAFRFALTGFFVLTGVHAVHVVGGLAALAWTGVKARRGGYGPEDHWGVSACAWYWHFLDAVWIAVFALLLLTGR